MNLFLLILIILVGLVFIFIEIFLIPGTSILTILGVGVVAIGVFLGYSEFGNTAGNLLFIGSIIGTGILLYIGYKRIRSKKWALFETIDGKVNVEDISGFKIGEIGISITALRPEGLVIFNNEIRQTVYSLGEYIDKNSEVKIVKIDQNKIFVKPVNN